MNERRTELDRSGQYLYRRRRFLGVFGGLLAGLLGGGGALAAKADPGVGPAAPRELPLREADFYRPHDLAG
jgi:hypothetical protein